MPATVPEPYWISTCESAPEDALYVVDDVVSNSGVEREQPSHDDVANQRSAEPVSRITLNV